MPRMISVIIPTLNDAHSLPRTLAPLVDGVAHGLVKQVIISDGGSRDATLEIADAAGCDIVAGEQGRGRQVRTGVAASKGRWLLILGADSALGAGWIAETERFATSAAARTRAGAFRLQFDDITPASKRALAWARMRARVMKLPYADQGLLLSRFLYDALGGYPDSDALAHAEFLARAGPKRVTLLETEVVTSAAKYLRGGANKGALDHIALMARSLMGADPFAVERAETAQSSALANERESSGV